MNLRVAKVIKKSLDALPYIISGAAVVGALICAGNATAGISYYVIGAVAIVAGLVVLGVKLYEKAEKTIREIEEGDEEVRQHHLDYYEGDKYNV